MSKNDNVKNPKHYTSHPSGVECIQITEHMEFCIGNAIKYLWRAGLKLDKIEDLKKAKWYIERELKRLGCKDVPVHESTVLTDADLNKLAEEYDSVTIEFNNDCNTALTKGAEYSASSTEVDGCGGNCKVCKCELAALDRKSKDYLENIKND